MEGAPEPKRFKPSRRKSASVEPVPAAPPSPSAAPAPGPKKPKSWLRKLDELTGLAGDDEDEDEDGEDFFGDDEEEDGEGDDE